MTLATNLPTVLAAVMDATTVYYSVVDTGGDCGGSSCPATTGGIYAVPRAGGAPKPLKEGVIAEGLALDDTSLYWASSTGSDFPVLDTVIGRMNKDGSAPTALVTTQTGMIQPSTLTLDADHVYFVENDGQDVSPTFIGRVSKTGGSVDTIAVPPPDHYNEGIAVDASGVYYFDKNAQAIVRVPKEGGTAVPVAAQSSAGGFVADPSGLYWATDAPSGNAASLMHLAPACQ